MVPRHTRETFRPLDPRLTYSKASPSLPFAQEPLRHPEQRLTCFTRHWPSVAEYIRSRFRQGSLFRSYSAPSGKESARTPNQFLDMLDDRAGDVDIGHRLQTLPAWTAVDLDNVHLSIRCRE